MDAESMVVPHAERLRLLTELAIKLGVRGAATRIGPTVPSLEVAMAQRGGHQGYALVVVDDRRVFSWAQGSRGHHSIDDIEGAVSALLTFMSADVAEDGPESAPGGA